MFVVNMKYITCFYLITVLMILRASSCGATLNIQIPAYDFPDYRGYTLATTRLEVLQCYFAIIFIYIL
jgi:hypothetical protein